MKIQISFRELITKLPDEARSAYLPVASLANLNAASEALASRIPKSKLPPDVAALYQISGGQPWKTSSEQELFPMFSLNPIERAVSDYKEMCDFDR